MICVITYSLDKISVFLANITFAVAGIIFKEAVLTSSVAKINFAVGEVTFIVAVITSSVDNISLFVARSPLWWLR